MVTEVSQVTEVTKGKKKEGIYFDFESLTWRNVDFGWVEFLVDKYPNVNVRKELTKSMPAWLYANRNGKGRKKNWERFITNWLSRCQERNERAYGPRA